MKKLISIACVLAFILSLTACSNNKTSTQEETSTPTINSSSEENTPTVKEENIKKYLNENSLNNTDNISFLLDSINDDEYIVVNIKDTDLIKDLKINYYSNTQKLSIDSEKLSLPLWNDFEVKFDNDIFDVSAKSSGKNGDFYQTWADSAYDSSILKEDGCLLLVKHVENGTTRPETRYSCWAKAKNQYVNIGEIGSTFLPFTTESEAIDAFNYIKAHYSFATIKTTTTFKNSISYEIPDLNSAKSFCEETALNIDNWVFVEDLVCKDFEDNGLNFVSSRYLRYDYGIISTTYYFELTDADYEAGLNWDELFTFMLDPIADGDSYDMGKTEKEFKIGDTQFKLTGIDKDNGNYSIKIKTNKGKEYICYIGRRGTLSESDYEYIQKYLEKIFSK